MIWQPIHVNVMATQFLKPPRPPASLLPLLSSGSSTQTVPHPVWTCNNKALINKMYFFVVILGASSHQHLCSAASVGNWRSNLKSHWNLELEVGGWGVEEEKRREKCRDAPPKAPLLFARPIYQKRTKKILPPCLRATSGSQKFSWKKRRKKASGKQRRTARPGDNATRAGYWCHRTRKRWERQSDGLCGDTTPGRKHASTSATSLVHLLRSENKGARRRKKKKGGGENSP